MKKILAIFLVGIMTMNLVAVRADAQVVCSDDPDAYLKGLPVVKKKGRPTVGLVLCGGGAKGAAHIGAIKVLEDYGVPIDLIVGTSIGALVGGMYSMGYTAHQMDSIMSNCDWSYLLSDKTSRTDVNFKAKEIESKFLINIPFEKLVKSGNKSEAETAADYLLPSGFVEGQNVYNLLSSLAMGYQDSLNFMDLPIPFACVATELATGHAIVLREGNLPLSMRASMAIPGFFSAVTMNGKVLVDGGVVDNFPVDVARKMGADIVIGVDIQSPLATNQELKSITQILNQLVGLTGNDLYLKNIKDVDVYIKPDVLNFSTFSFNKEAVDSLIVNGYTAAMEKSDELKALVHKYGRVSAHGRLQAPAAKEVTNEFFYVNRIFINGVEKSEKEWLKNQIKLREKTFVQGSDILRAVSILSGTKAFSNVSYEILENPTTSESTVIFSLKKGPTNVIGLGARYDSEEAAAILLYLGMNVNSIKGVQLGVTGRLSYNPYAKIDFSYLYGNLPKLNLDYTFRSVKMNIYEDGDNINYLSYLYNKVDFSISNRYFRNFNISCGVRLETFKYKDLMPPYDATRFYKKGVAYLGYYFNGKMDNRDASYFPTTGGAFNVDVALYQTNFKSDFSMVSTLSSSFQGVMSVSDRFTFLPALYGCFLLGNEDQLPFKNYIGGEVSSRYMPNQMPFIGINYANIFPDAAAIARLDFRGRIGKKHYITAMGNYARYGESIEHLWKKSGDGMWGVGLKYSYDSHLGPLSFNIHYSDYNQKVGAYVNLGYYF